MLRPLTSPWLTPFKGAGHTFMDCEVLALEKLDPATREKLWTSCEHIWFDYVRLHPVKSLYLFCEAYSVMYGRYLEQNVDQDMKWSRGLKGDPMDSREVRQLVALKAEADKLTMPYPLFVSSMFKFFSGNGWTRPPRPSHMLGSEEALERTRQSWLEALGGMGMYATDPWFAAEAWVGHREQQRYEEWLIQTISLREHKEYSLYNALYLYGQLRVERAIQEYGTDKIRLAQNLAAARYEDQ